MSLPTKANSKASLLSPEAEKYPEAKKVSIPPEPSRRQGSLAELSDRDYAFIRRLIYEETRINLGERKRQLVAARLGKRLRALGCPRLSDYCRRLQNNPEDGEIYHLIDAISTNHTFFFRERDHFDFLASSILPAFSRGEYGDRQQLRVWSCACSTGEEPYSIAISLAECFEHLPDSRWKLACSDISTRVLDFAAKGVYHEGQLGQISLLMREKYFQKGRREMQGYARVHPRIRKQIEFYRLNLFAPSYPWPERFHVIFCRNVMIYFDRATQEDLVGRLSQRLLPGGYLVIGHAESLMGFKHDYQSVKPSIYRLPAQFP